MLSGESRVSLVVGAIVGVAGLLGGLVLAGRGADAAPQPTTPFVSNPNLRVPPGIYTAMVFSSVSGQIFTLRAAGMELPVSTKDVGTVVVPFATPWQLGQEGTINLYGTYGNGTAAWGITTSGPVMFEIKK